MFELPNHISLVALGQPWCNDSHYADLVATCHLANDISDDPEITELAQRGLQMLLERHDGYDEMRHVIGTVLQWVGQQPNSKIYTAALKRLKDIDESTRIS